MKIDSRTKGFSFNEKKNMLLRLQILAKLKGTTVSDIIRASNRRVEKTNRKEIEEEMNRLGIPLDKG